MANMEGVGVGVGRIEPDAYYQRELREHNYTPVTTVFCLLAIIIPVCIQTAEWLCEIRQLSMKMKERPE